MMPSTPKRKQREQATWGPTQITPGGTPYQAGEVGGEPKIRKETKTPGGKTSVLHRYCAPPVGSGNVNGGACTEDAVCRPCQRKNNQANVNARRKKTSNQRSLFGEDSEDKKRSRNSSRRENYSAMSDGERNAINATRRAAHKGVLYSYEYNNIEVAKGRVKRHWEELENMDPSSQDYSWRKDMYSRGLEEIHKEYERLCGGEIRIISAMYEYGLFLLFGCDKYGFEQNPEKAIRYFKEAADFGHADANLTLSEIYGGAITWSIPLPEFRPDMALSLKYMTAAAACSRWDGHKAKRDERVAPEEAHYALYEGYMTGILHDVADAIGVDKEEALTHLIKAAEGGHKVAEFDLYVHHHVEGDPEKASDWLHRAASPNRWIDDEDGDLIEARSNVLLSALGDSSEAVKERVLRDAIRKLEPLARAGSKRAQTTLAWCYQEKFHITPIAYDDISMEPLSLPARCVNDTKALYWLRKAAQNGSIGSSSWLSLYYRLGLLGLEINLEQSFKWMLLSACDGDEDSQFNVAAIYIGKAEPDYGVNVNYEKGLQWLHRAARNGHKDALYRLGECYHYSVFLDPVENDGSTSASHAYPIGNTDADGYVWYAIPEERVVLCRNAQRAYRCFMKAARAGSWEAMSELAHIYEFGALKEAKFSDPGGVVADVDKSAALMWREKAEAVKGGLSGGGSAPGDGHIGGPSPSESDSDSGSELSFLGDTDSYPDDRPEIENSDSESPDTEGDESEEGYEREKYDETSCYSDGEQPEDDYYE